MDFLGISLWIWFFGVMFVLFWVGDIYCWVTRDYDTFSRKMVRWTRTYPLLPFFIGLGIGVAAGHFWPNTGCYV